MSVYSKEGQAVFLVLYALLELGGVCSKQEVLDFIERAEYYDLKAHDLPPYKNQTEPRYHTLVGWARFHAVQLGWMVDVDEKDNWQLSRDGRGILDRTIQRYRSGELSVRECYLWTPKFKKLVDPTYEPSPKDRQRFERVYE